MDELYLVLSVFLLLNVLAGLVRVLRGPTPADRMLSAQLFGTTGVATLLLLAGLFAGELLFVKGIRRAVRRSREGRISRSWGGSRPPSGRGGLPEGNDQQDLRSPAFLAPKRP